MGEPTLGEFLAQASRGAGGGYLSRSSGPLPGYLFGPDFMKKAGSLQISDTFIATYGKKVWDALNNRTVTFNAIKKVDWGPTVGWRLRSDRGSGRSGPVSETGTIPTIDTSAYEGIYAYPKSIASTFGVSLKAQAVSALEGGIGNQFAVEQEATSRDHIKEINQELMAGGAYLASGGADANHVIIGGATAAYLLAGNFRVGDTINTTASSYAACTITAIDTATGIITATGINGTDGQAVAISARNGLTTIDDICMDGSSSVGGDTATHVRPAIYNKATRTTATYLAPAQDGYNAGVGRDLTLALIDTAIQKIRQNGGEPKLIVTGLDQYDKINQLLQTQQRFMDVSDYIVGVGDERTYPGTRAGFQLATYRGIPILPDPDTSKSMSTTDAVLGSNLYVLDTDYLEIAVMYPTQYIENRDYFSATTLTLRGMFVTMMEMRCLRFDVQAAVKDLNT
jgi:hypothetical protein